MVTREELYEEVWAAPMLAVAAKYKVSSSFLARVCERLGVPRPPRGYWAKAAAGKAPARAALPAAQPDDLLEWSRGGELPRRAPRPLPQPEPPTSPPRLVRKRSERPTLHPLLAGALESFRQTRESVLSSDVPYLRPYKRKLIDLVVSNETLTRALNVANELFLTLEDRGHRVVLAPWEAQPRFSRKALEYREQPPKSEYYDRDTWSPDRPTIVLVGTVAIGLTVFETSEEVEVRWVEGGYVRVSEAPIPKRGRFSQSYDTWTHKKQMPTGRLVIRAYSPYPRTSWEDQFRVPATGDLSSKAVEVARELAGAAPNIAQLAAEGERQAEEERKRLEEQHQKWEEECREKQRKEALQQSRTELLAIVEAWALARRIDEFFRDAAAQVAGLAEDERTALTARVQAARDMLGGTDSLRRLRAWRTPLERLHGQHS